MEQAWPCCRLHLAQLLVAAGSAAVSCRRSDQSQLACRQLLASFLCTRYQWVQAVQSIGNSSRDSSCRCQQQRLNWTACLALTLLLLLLKLVVKLLTYDCNKPDTALEKACCLYYKSANSSV
eukprot:13500-Heterococcus_DN1.PRE.2